MLLSNEKERDKIQKKKHLDFLDILLCSKVSVLNYCTKFQRRELCGTKGAAAQETPNHTSPLGIKIKDLFA